MTLIVSAEVNAVFKSRHGDNGFSRGSGSTDDRRQIRNNNEISQLSRTGLWTFSLIKPDSCGEELTADIGCADEC